MRNNKYQKDKKKKIHVLPLLCLLRGLSKINRRQVLMQLKKDTMLQMLIHINNNSVSDLTTQWLRV